ncbi:hypothetical protein RHGRI_015494 [Rhododendron griersonianum]|uniref:F-box associated beta-propeller type 1 domain-containing protein n=1 Tax=Rhododendron griersonianum TaxID=479676 RepID=A0AAV6KE34_9ERIC|nr:hypothetical protein RHGRI_015494 [Rhododendron griersonianum]
MSLIFNDGFHSNGPISLDFPFLNRMPSLSSCEYSREDHFNIGGICNGLVCISLSPFGYPLILCNPATRQFREIPNSEWKWLDDHVEINQVSFGFGYHPSSNDYKLIRIVLYSSLMEEHSFKADVYVMRTGTWREIDADKVSVFLGEKDNLGRLGSYVLIDGFCASAVLNGVFYWTACVMSTDSTSHESEVKHNNELVLNKKRQGKIQQRIHVKDSCRPGSLAAVNLAHAYLRSIVFVTFFLDFLINNEAVLV